MRENDWVFQDEYDTAVLTTKAVVRGSSPIRYASHDADDGMWQFHDGSNAKEEDAMIVSLGEIASMDPTLEFVADLPLGWSACRQDKGEVWNRQKEE